jgi:hypothetical protein
VNLTFENEVTCLICKHSRERHVEMEAVYFCKIYGCYCPRYISPSGEVGRQKGSSERTLT